MEAYWGKTVKKEKEKEEHYVSTLLINSGDWPIRRSLFRDLDYGRRPNIGKAE